MLTATRKEMTPQPKTAPTTGGGESAASAAQMKPRDGSSPTGGFKRPLSPTNAYAALSKQKPSGVGASSPTRPAAMDMDEAGGAEGPALKKQDRKQQFGEVDGKPPAPQLESSTDAATSRKASFAASEGSAEDFDRMPSGSIDEGDNDDDDFRESIESGESSQEEGDEEEGGSWGPKSGAEGSGRQAQKVRKNQEQGSQSDVSEQWFKGLVRRVQQKNPNRGGGKGPAGGKWRDEEDEHLRAIVKAHGAKNWKKVAELLGTSRTDVQCLHRWNKVLRPGLHKGPWTEDEDELVRQMVEKNGVGQVKWSVIAARLPGRIGKQCRERWFNHLDPAIKKGTWAEEEDQILFESQRYLGNRWCEIVKLLPGRTENAVKNRFNSAARKKWLNSHPEGTCTLGPEMVEKLKQVYEQAQQEMETRQALQKASRQTGSAAGAAGGLDKNAASETLDDPVIATAANFGSHLESVSPSEIPELFGGNTSHSASSKTSFHERDLGIMGKFSKAAAPATSSKTHENVPALTVRERRPSTAFRTAPQQVAVKGAAATAAKRRGSVKGPVGLSGAGLSSVLVPPSIITTTSSATSPTPSQCSQRSSAAVASSWSGTLADTAGYSYLPVNATTSSSPVSAAVRRVSVSIPDLKPDEDVPLNLLPFFKYLSVEARRGIMRQLITSFSKNASISPLITEALRRDMPQAVACDGSKSTSCSASPVRAASRRSFNTAEALGVESAEHLQEHYSQMNAAAEGSGGHQTPGLLTPALLSLIEEQLGDNPDDLSLVGNFKWDSGSTESAEAAGLALSLLSPRLASILEGHSDAHNKECSRDSTLTGTNTPYMAGLTPALAQLSGLSPRTMDKAYEALNPGSN